MVVTLQYKLIQPLFSEPPYQRIAQPMQYFWLLDAHLIRFVRRFPRLLLCFLLTSGIVVAPVLWNMPMRDAYVLTVQRYIARLMPPRFVFVGDSLTAGTHWGWALARNPLSAANLAEGGTSISQISLQMGKAGNYRAEYLFVLAGTNDIVIHDRTVPQIAADFEFLLQQAPRRMRIIVTLIPYTSFAKHTEKIRAANLEIQKLADKKGAKIIDINPRISTNGLLDRDLSIDGIHLNGRAYAIWAEEILKRVKL
jgi:lysophospholipase L1-like esterase